MQYVKYNPADEFYKSVVGAVEENVRFGIKIQLRREVNPAKVTLAVFRDDGLKREFVMYKEEGADGYDNYIADVSFEKGLYFYYFVMDGVSYEKYIGIGPDRQACLFYDNVNPYQLSVYAQKYDTPVWLNKGVMYQIMVDRFCKVGETVATEDKIMRSWGEQPFFAT